MTELHVGRRRTWPLSRNGGCRDDANFARARTYGCDVAAARALGVGLGRGPLPRAAPLGGLLLIGPIYSMLLPTNLYLWQYPAEDLLPLVFLTIVPTWSRSDFAQKIRGRLPQRWPF